MKPTTRTTRKLPRLLGTLREKKSLLIVMQDSPDPDAVAAAAALRYIANQTFGIVCTLAHGGAVGRDAPVKQNDHAMDDIRYFAVSVAGGRDGFAAAWAER